MIEFRTIPSSQGMYYASDEGDIYSTYSQKILKPFINTRGYLVVTLYVEGRRYKRTVHSLVMESFVGTRPDGFHIKHLDEDKTNNTLSNLEYATHQKNVEYSISKVYEFISPVGEVVTIKNLEKFCRDFELNSGHMNSVFYGRRKQHKGWRAVNV